MNIAIHRADERGIAEHGWLHSRFSFSFAQYHNSERMGYGPLRVINDDIIEPLQGFGMHPHNDMEIITIILKGALEHKDSEGNHDITKEGQIQYMSAGSGIYHSEFNPSSSDNAELFQIWIRPNVHGGKPHYAKRDFTAIDDHNKWKLLVSPNGSENSILIKQEASLCISHLSKGLALKPPSCPSAVNMLLLVIEGSVKVGEEKLNRRDEAQWKSTEEVNIEAEEDSHLLLFLLPI